MRHIWRLVLITALVMVSFGAVCAVIGILTGASTERMIEVFFGSRETFELTIRLLRDELTGLF